MGAQMCIYTGRLCSQSQIEQYTSILCFDGCVQAVGERERMQGLTAPVAAFPATAALLRRRTAGAVTQQVQHALPGRARSWRRQRSHQGN